MIKLILLQKIIMTGQHNIMHNLIPWFNTFVFKRCIKSSNFDEEFIKCKIQYDLSDIEQKEILELKKFIAFV